MSTASPFSGIPLFEALKQLRHELDQSQATLKSSGKEPLIFLTEGELELQLELQRELTASGEVKADGGLIWAVLSPFKAKAAVGVSSEKTTTHTLRLKLAFAPPQDLSGGAGGGGLTAGTDGGRRQPGQPVMDKIRSRI